MKSTALMMQYSICSQAARCALRFAPIAPMRPVTAEPMFAPIRAGSMAPKVSDPDMDIDCSTPMEAEELCRITVTTRPTSSPRNGFSAKAVIRLVKDGSSARPENAPDIIVMPIISTANPTKMVAAWRVLSFFASISIATPARARIGAKLSGLTREITTLSPETMVSDSSQAVMVVPTLAPIVTPTDCSSVIMPELTRPTTMTTVAPED